MLFLQPSSAAFPLQRDIVPEELMERLRHDPAVIEAIAGKGRILAVEPIRLDRLDLPPLEPNPPWPFG